MRTVIAHASERASANIANITTTTGNTVGGGSSWLLKRDLDPASNDNSPMWLTART